jgi:hypothetical protein
MRAVPVTDEDGLRDYRLSDTDELNYVTPGYALLLFGMVIVLAGYVWLVGACRGWRWR